VLSFSVAQGPVAGAAVEPPRLGFALVAEGEIQAITYDFWEP
jgi:hypothetical protein